MGFNSFISKLFGNKASRDMREIQPWVEKVKAVYPAGFADVTLVSGTIAGGGALPNMLYSGEARTAIGEAYDAIFAGDDIQKNMDEANAIMQELLDQEAAEK